MTTAHQTLVAKQFGAHAAAYVTSAVHAAGEDLKQIGALAAALKPARALDLGCGGGHVSFTVAPHSGEVTAYDLSQEMLAAVAQAAAGKGLANIRTQQGKTEVLPFGDATFDLVATRYSAHHWHSVPQALKEARRVITKTGRAIFADTVTPGAPLLDTWLQSLELLRDPSHVRNYSQKEWLEMIAAAGFLPAKPVIRRVHIDYTSWLARLATPEVNADAIRSLHHFMPQEVAVYFELEPDGSFTFDSMTVEATPV